MFWWLVFYWAGFLLGAAVFMGSLGSARSAAR